MSVCLTGGLVCQPSTTSVPPAVLQYTEDEHVLGTTLMT